MAANRPQGRAHRLRRFLRYVPIEPQVLLMVCMMGMFAFITCQSIGRAITYPRLDWSDIPMATASIEKETAGGSYMIYRQQHSGDFLRDSASPGEGLSLYAHGRPDEFRDAIAAWAIAHGGALAVDQEWSSQYHLRVAMPQSALDRLALLPEDDEELQSWIAEVREGVVVQQGTPLVSSKVILSHGRSRSQHRDRALMFGFLSVMIGAFLLIIHTVERRNRRGADAIRNGRIWA